jgi:glycosyltransferase involved in cell wall biosynthesis
MKKNIVYLLSHMYNNVSGGAGTYAHYLYNTFKNNEDFDFVLVTHDVYKCTNNILKTKNYNNFYKNIEEYYKAVELHSKEYTNIIVHANTAIELYYFKNTSFKLIANVNDYEVVDIYKFIPKFISWYKLSSIKKILGKIKARYYEKNVLNNVDLIMTNSNYTKSRIIKGYGFDEDKVAVIHKAVDVSLFNKNDNILNTTKSKNKLKTILFVGTDWQRKGLVELLEAVKLLKDKDYYVNLTILGIKNKGEIKKIEKIVEKLNLNNIYIHGLVTRDDIADYYINSDLFVLPTKLEAFGVSYIEAMSSGLFTIGSNLGGVPEIINDSTNGLLLDHINKDEISTKIKIFLDEEIDIEKIILDAKKTADSFKTEVMLEKIHKRYLGIFNK